MSTTEPHPVEVPAGYALHALPIPASKDEPIHPLTAAYHALRLQYDLDTHGHNDFNESLASFHAGSVATAYSRTARWVVLPAEVEAEAAPADSAVAFAVADLSLTDNTHTVDMHAYVAPAHRGTGLGHMLVAVLENLAAAENRTTVNVWLTSQGEPDGPAAVQAKSGSGAVNGEVAGARLLQALGFELEQVEAQSSLDVPAPGPARDQFERQVTGWRDGAAAVAGADYRMVSWLGGVPPEYRTAFARLRQHMSVDAPNAGLDYEEEVWTEERVADHDAKSAESGFQQAYTVAIHVPSGQIAAYTQYEWPLDRPAGVWQGDTFVDREHRGHRLGMLVKAVNLALLLEANPAVARIHTWNADENAHMLAINHQMGFTLSSVDGAWEKRRG